MSAPVTGAARSAGARPSRPASGITANERLSEQRLEPQTEIGWRRRAHGEREASPGHRPGQRIAAGHVELHPHGRPVTHERRQQRRDIEVRGRCDRPAPQRAATGRSDLGGLRSERIEVTGDGVGVAPHRLTQLAERQPPSVPHEHRSAQLVLELPDAERDLDAPTPNCSAARPNAPVSTIARKVESSRRSIDIQAR